MPRRNVSLLISLATVVLGFQAGAADVILHDFTFSTGSSPYGSLTAVGTSLYGMTRSGGAGVIFTVNNDGSNYSVLHRFSEMSGPFGAVTISGPTMYGMNLFGVFRMNIDGGGYTILHNFSGGTADGSMAFGSLELVGSTLYGMTENNGANNWGVVFKVDTNGSNFSLLHSFAGGASQDGAYPEASLTYFNGAVYGMTLYGGSNAKGMIFKVNADGSGYANLHSFAGTATDGDSPFGSLTLSGSTFYGTTKFGGASGKGTVFKINADGSDFSVLHSFAGTPSDGANPYGSVAISGTTLYGTTGVGGANNLGTVFEVQTNGSNFALDHSFAGGSDGSSPWPYDNKLAIIDPTLYGMTPKGGSAGTGVLFAITVPEPASGLLFAFGGMAMLGRFRGRSNVLLSKQRQP